MYISPEDGRLQYSGRIDFEVPEAPVFIYAASSVRLRFRGTRILVELANRRVYWTNEMGYFLDGVQGKIRLSSGEARQCYPIGENLEDTEHELLLFKRMDACHIVTFYGFEVSEGAVVLPPPNKPKRRIEVFGDSVSCGEVSEAVDFVGKEDPEHDGEYSNSWYSYAWMTARALHTELHDTSQGGIALLDGTGWFGEPDSIGMKSCYDKLLYNPQLGTVKQWDFTRYVPHVVIVALGQNDSHPDDYMAKDYDGSRAICWRTHYRAFVERMMEIYPKSQIILTTTLLCHDASWDRAIGEVCGEIGSARVHHFLYQRNGAGTPGHPRIPEAEEMAEELTGYIQSLGEEIWED